MSKHAAPSTPEEISAAVAEFNAEKLPRRRALKKFGITTGMTVFGMFAADDLARLVIKKMEEHKETRQIAETVAQEFQDSGIAYAATLKCGANGCSDAQLGFNCDGCSLTPQVYGSQPVEGGTCAQCVINACGRCFGTNPDGTLTQAGLLCQARVGDNYCP